MIRLIGRLTLFLVLGFSFWMVAAAIRDKGDQVSKDGKGHEAREISEFMQVVGSKEFNTFMDLKTLQKLYLVLPNGINLETLTYMFNPMLVTYPEITYLPSAKQLKILVTGGAGFVGSHLVDRLMIMGHSVTVIDNLFTGNKKNIQHWIGHPNFEFVRHDIIGIFQVI